MDISGAVAQFPVGDAVVFVRCRATALDRSIFDALVGQASKELIRGGAPRISRDLAQLFVCGWNGMTVGGRPAPYSWSILEEVLPPDAALALERFVAESVDILKQP